MEIKEVRISRIKEKMNEHGLNSRELSKKCGVSESGISRILTGEIEPRLKTFIKIADALKCDYVWLMGYDEQKTRFDTYRPIAIEQHITEGLNEKSLEQLKSYAAYLRMMQDKEDSDNE